MKTILLIFSVVMMSNSAHAESATFIHPSSWGIPLDDHYNTFIEDEKHPCYIKSNGRFNSEKSCDYSFKDIEYENGYIFRDCGFAGQCSYENDKSEGIFYYHAGVDYDLPNHQHDPEDYTDGKRKYEGLRQGLGVDIDCDNHEDDKVVASNSGKVVFAQYQGSYGNTIIIKHYCNPSDSGSQLLCGYDEDDELVIYTQYSHLSEIIVNENDIVGRGQKIGVIGRANA